MSWNVYVREISPAIDVYRDIVRFSRFLRHMDVLSSSTGLR